MSPAIALLHPVPCLVDGVTLGDLEFQLCRRVVEIRDGTLVLPPYAHSEVATLALDRCRVYRLDKETEIIAGAANLAVLIDAEPPAGSTVAEPSSRTSWAGRIW